MSSAEAVARARRGRRRARPGAAWPRLEERLRSCATSHGPLLAEHAGATIAAGGKRLRPLLVLLAAGPSARADPTTACCAPPSPSSSSTRRRSSTTTSSTPRRCAAAARPSSPPAGRAIATATGDLLFARAFAELAAQRPPRRRSASSPTRRSALARGELLQREDAWDADVTVERYLDAASSRPRACSRPPASSARWRAAGGATRSARFGRRIGLAFQLLDDVLDVSGPAERTGKHRGTDLLDGTVTLPLILARERDPELAALDLRAIRTPEDAEALCDAIAATGALEDARAPRRSRWSPRRRRSCRSCPRPQRARARARGRRRRRPLR